MKKINKILLIATLAISFNNSLLATDNGEELFKNKCGICHPMTRPADRSQMIAPPAKGLMFHMSEELESDEKILAHINSFVINPSKEKAICRSVKRFGLMPSQKGIITNEELDIVAKWMVDNLKMSKQDYQNRKNRRNR